MAWENATVREIATGSTTNDTYYTNTSSNNYYRSGDEGPFSDVTFELSFLPKDYMSYEPGDYYLVGNAQYGIFLRKTGAAGANDGSVALKASYLGEADNNGSSPSVIGSWSVKSPYSDIWRQVSILCGVNEETQKGTIISYARWSGWCGRSDDYAIIHDAYNRYNNSTIGYNVIKKIKTLSDNVSGGAGSGYIGNALLSNKKMVGYNVPTSSDESTKTESVLQASETPIAGVPKIGNGHVRIRCIEVVTRHTLLEIAKTIDTTSVYTYVNNAWWDSYQNAFSQYLGTATILQCVRNGGSRIQRYDGENLDTNDKYGVSETRIWIPINRVLVSKLTVTGYTTNYGSYRYGYVNLVKIENDSLVDSASLQLPVASASEKTVSYEFSAPFEADYLSLQAGDGQIYMNNIIFE